MITLTKPVRRLTRDTLDSFYGCKVRGRQLRVSLEPGDLLVMAPKGTRQVETLSLFDAYRFAITCRANQTKREKEAARKAKRDEAKERARLKRALRKPAIQNP